jgi:hypothetical protein
MLLPSETVEPSPFPARVNDTAVDGEDLPGYVRPVKMASLVITECGKGNKGQVVVRVPGVHLLIRLGDAVSTKTYLFELLSGSAHVIVSSTMLIFRFNSSY